MFKVLEDHVCFGFTQIRILEDHVCFGFTQIHILEDHVWFGSTQIHKPCIKNFDDKKDKQGFYLSQIGKKKFDNVQKSFKTSCVGMLQQRSNSQNRKRNVETKIQGEFTKTKNKRASEEMKGKSEKCLFKSKEWIACDKM